MPDINQKLDRFTAKILAEAAAESRRAMEEVQRRREQRIQEAEDEVLKEAYDYIHTEVSRIQAEAGRGVSRHMLDNKRTLSLRRRRWPRRSLPWCGPKSPPSPVPPPTPGGWPR